MERKFFASALPADLLRLTAAVAGLALASGCGRVTMVRDDGGRPDTGAVGGKDGPAMQPSDLPVAPSSPVPPDTWTEHWFEHNQTLNLVAYDNDAAVYFDRDVVPAGSEWILPLVSSAWRYTRLTYGDYQSGTGDGRFYAIFHQGKYAGCHAGYYLDANHDNRNASDCGPGPWTTPNVGELLFWMASVVEFNSNHMTYSSPAHELWDARFNEFFIYDTLMALGRASDAQAAYDTFMANFDARPRLPTYWFRDWFFPLWRDHGHGQVMARFFELTAQYVAPVDAEHPQGRMTMAEMVHFMSGASGTNLKALAVTAFGAEAVSDPALEKARANFPQITY